jgi:hypothetical protein
MKAEKREVQTSSRYTKLARQKIEALSEPGGKEFMTFEIIACGARGEQQPEEGKLHSSAAMNEHHVASNT